MSLSSVRGVRRRALHAGPLRLAVGLTAVAIACGSAAGQARAAYTSLADSDYTLQLLDSDIRGNDGIITSYVSAYWPNDDLNNAQISRTVERAGAMVPPRTPAPTSTIVSPSRRTTRSG